MCSGCRWIRRSNGDQWPRRCEGTSVLLTLLRPVDDQGAAPKPEGKSDVKPDASKEPGKAGDEVKAAKDTKPKQEVEVKVTRSVITVPTVKGWKREGVREDSWDWFIDNDNHIGYVRLLQFSESTSHELDRAIADMKQPGAQGAGAGPPLQPGRAAGPGGAGGAEVHPRS